MKPLPTVAVAFAGLTVVAACSAIDPPPGPAAPVNACPDHPCDAYASALSDAGQNCAVSPCCIAGKCLVQSQTAGLAMLITLPEDSYFAPSRTFAVAFDELFSSQPPVVSKACAPPDCFTLPDWGLPRNQYLVSAALAKNDPPAGVGWDLGNPGYTALPATATFRFMWSTGAGAVVDAESIGLPVPPVEAALAADSFGIPGPGGGASIFYETYLPPGTYERIVRPKAPFDRAFAPEIKTMTVSPGMASEPPDDVESFDVTSETGQPGVTLPTFTISCANPLDGWTAYLRDSSQQVISNVFPLHGTRTPNVVLATNHVPDGVDALTNATLVIAPPPGSPFPTGVFSPVANILPADERYPALPDPVPLAGHVRAMDGTEVAADVVFEAIAIADVSGNEYSSNFEFVASTKSRISVPEAGAGAVATGYSVVLPPGRYRATVRPTLTTYAVATTSPVDVDAAQKSLPDLWVDAPRAVAGDAVVADGRPLSDAIVEASPAGCVDGTSTWCLPRPAATTTALDGTFALALDPGQYVLRVRPAQGSRLPWVVEPLSVLGNIPANYIVKPHVKVPAPSSAGLTLFDPSGNRVVNAVVRAFWVPASGSALEIGESLTGADGRYEMYLTPPSQ